MLLHGRHDGLRECEVEGVGATGESRGTEQLAVVDGRDGPEGVRCRPVDELGDFAVVLTPTCLQWYRVVLEIVQHARDGVEEEVLNAAAG